MELLKEKKYILIEEDSQNRRQHKLTLTESGKKYTIRAIVLLDKHFEQRYKKLSAAQQKVFADSLELLVAEFCKRESKEPL